MHSEPKDSNKLESNAHSIPPSTICPQPWWRGIEYNAIPPAVLGESGSKSQSLEHPNGGVGSKAGQSQTNGRLDEEADVHKDMKTTTAKQSGASPRNHYTVDEIFSYGSDGDYGEEHQHLQHVASPIPPSMGEYLAPPTQMELVGHTIACTSYPYMDPYYGGMITAYGPQALPYLHESRHQHAMRRARGCGGRFLNTKNLDCSTTNLTPEKANGSGAALSTQSASSSGSEPLPSNCTGNMDSSSHQQKVNGPLVQNMHEAHMYHNGNANCNSNGCYQHHQGLPLSTYHSLSGKRGEEGECSGQQRGSIPVNRAPHRALTIQ
ncbi:hypothetical protein HHK36_017305 [Tetracentron sinense]|uniref:Nuclear transcription factor Y subunit n=1 Tax=Tetracentron sinense TaxID=13715 RepID=A0A834Z506_TETSI|nr:hypothetical protein HHK36_017305 [Tetracentron sinense]